nr:MAG TPA: hypothetical protein [Caudoviricetes sp.]
MPQVAPRVKGVMLMSVGICCLWIIAKRKEKNDKDLGKCRST